MMWAFSQTYKNVLLIYLFKIKFLYTQDKRSTWSDLIIINTILEVSLLSHCRACNVLLSFIFSNDFSNVMFCYYLLLSPTRTSDTSHWQWKNSSKQFSVWQEIFFMYVLWLMALHAVCFAEVTLTSLIVSIFSKHLLVPSSMAFIVKSNFLQGVWFLFYFI